MRSPLRRLEDLKGMAREIGRHSIDDLHVASDAERTSLFRKMLTLLQSRRFWPDGSALAPVGLQSGHDNRLNRCPLLEVADVANSRRHVRL
jgi:hypothetical protein